jgi:FkbM family methyltransferase
MSSLNKLIEYFALRKLVFNGAFIKKILHATSSKALKDAYGTDKKELISVLYKIRSLVTEVTDEFPQSANKDHLERTVDALKRHVQASNGLFIDLGAASGSVSNEFLQAFPDNEFHLFEPLEDSYNACVKKFTGYDNVKVHRKAVGNTNSRTIIHKTKSSTSSSLLNFSKDIATDFFKERFEMDLDEQIEVLRLDDFLKTEKAIWLIKLDVQGYEIPALEGSRNLLKQTYFVLCEMMNHDNYVDAPQYFDIDLFLRNAGFKLADMAPGLRRNGKLQEFDSLYYNAALVEL